MEYQYIGVIVWGGIINCIIHENNFDNLKKYLISKCIAENFDGSTDDCRIFDTNNPDIEVWSFDPETDFEEVFAYINVTREESATIKVRLQADQTKEDLQQQIRENGLTSISIDDISNISWQTDNDSIIVEQILREES